MADCQRDHGGSPAHPRRNCIRRRSAEAPVVKGLRHDEDPRLELMERGHCDSYSSH